MYIIISPIASFWHLSSIAISISYFTAMNSKLFLTAILVALIGIVIAINGIGILSKSIFLDNSGTGYVTYNLTWMTMSCHSWQLNCFIYCNFLVLDKNSKAAICFIWCNITCMILQFDSTILSRSLKPLDDVGSKQWQ